MSTHRRKWSKVEKLSALAMYKKDGVAATCRQFNVSMSTLYKWRDRFEAFGEAGFDQAGRDQKSFENNQLLNENKRLKQLIADKELQLMIQAELLKKSRYK